MAARILKPIKTCKFYDVPLSILWIHRDLLVLCFSVGLLLFFLFLKLRVWLRSLHFFINPLIFLIKSLNNTEKLYSRKKHFSSSLVCF